MILYAAMLQNNRKESFIKSMFIRRQNMVGITCILISQIQCINTSGLAKMPVILYTYSNILNEWHEWQFLNFKSNFNENVPCGLAHKKPTLNLIMTWRQIGDTHYLKQWLPRLLTRIPGLSKFKEYVQFALIRLNKNADHGMRRN